jgi:chromate transporter
VKETEGRPKLLPFLALSLFLGIAGFGGGYAIAQRMRRALVDDRKWLTADAFVESFSVATSLPGTTTANLFTVFGHRLGGTLGALLGTIAFLAPSIVIMMVFGAVYDRVRDLGVAAKVLDGMSVATVGVVAAAAVEMRKDAIKNGLGWSLAIASAVTLSTRMLNLLEVIAIAGIIGAIALRPITPRSPSSPGESAFLLAFAAPAVLPLGALFLVFARIGIATFGGGIAMIAPIEHQVVEVHGWLGPRAFADAIVLGQITPGPVGISSTFIGWRVGGPLGALAATFGMFGPPFVLAIVASRSLGVFRTNASVRGFLAGVAPAVIGAIVAAGISLARSTVHAWWQALLAAACFAVLTLRPKLTPLVPIAAAGLVELAVRH